MKPKTIIVLIVFMAVCLGGLWAIKAVKESRLRKLQESAQSRRLFDTPPRDVVGVVVTAAGGQRLAFERDKTNANEWRLVSPVKAKAVSSMVSGIIRAAADATYKRAFSPADAQAVSPHATGLDKPLWTVELTGEKGETLSLEVGRPAPMTRGETYVRPKGDAKTYVAAEDFAQRLDHPAQEFRDKTVLTFTTTDAVGLALRGRELGGAKLLLRRSDGDWGIQSPYDAKADAEAVKDILSKLAYLTAAAFVPEGPRSLSSYGLDPNNERLVVTVSLKTTEPYTPPATGPASAPAATQPAPEKTCTIAFGQTTGDDKVYARLADEPAVFQLNNSLLEDLLKKLGDIRDKKVIEFDAASVSAIDLDVGGRTAALSRKDGAWRMDTPYSGKANESAVRKLLDKMLALRAQSWADDKTAQVPALHPPAGTITLHLAGKGQTVGLVVGGPAPDGGTYVKTVAGTFACDVKADDANGLLQAPPAYWDPTILSIPYDERFEHVTIARPPPQGIFHMEASANDTWRLTAPIVAEADQDQVFKILGALSNLSADTVVAVGPRVPQKFAAAADKIAVEVQTKARATADTAPATEPATRPASKPVAASSPATAPAAPAGMAKTYVVTLVKLDGKSYAWVPGAAVTAVGEMSPSLWEDFAGELRDRRIWSLEPNDVQGIRIVNGDDRTDLRRDKNEWVRPLQPSAKINAEAANSFLADLKHLKADRFVKYQSADADLAEYGLKGPLLTLELRTASGKTLTLSVSDKGPKDSANRYALAPPVEGVFVLSPATVARIAKSLKDFTRTEEPQRGGPGGNPSFPR